MATYFGELLYAGCLSTAYSCNEFFCHSAPYFGMRADSNGKAHRLIVIAAAAVYGTL